MLRVLVLLLVCAVAFASGVWLRNVSKTADATIRTNNQIRATAVRLEQRLDGLAEARPSGELEGRLADSLARWDEAARAQRQQDGEFQARIDARLSALETQLGDLEKNRLTAADIASLLDRGFDDPAAVTDAAEVADLPDQLKAPAADR